MSNPLPEERSDEPVTTDSLTDDFHDLGLRSGDTAIVHSSLSSLGWVCGGPPAVIDALQRVITPSGNIVMPTHSPGNRDPADMHNPPVPEDWYDTIREQMPPYRPAVTPTRGMGAIPECFRSYPGVHRSDHPQHSFAAWGADADKITADHGPDYSFGEESPLAEVYELGGYVLLLGVDHGANTSLSLAEYRADLDIETETRRCAIVTDGQRVWASFEELAFDHSDFQECGAAFEDEYPEAAAVGSAGVAQATLVSQVKIVDFAVEWFETHRQ